MLGRGAQPSILSAATRRAARRAGAGLLDEVQHSGAPGSAAYVRATRAVHTLISDAEMGELFKAIAFGRGVPDDALGFRSADRRAVLSAGVPTDG